MAQYSKCRLLTCIIYMYIYYHISISNYIYGRSENIEKRSNFYKEINEYALDLIDKETDLSFLTEFLKQTNLKNNHFFKKVAITLFAPTNEAFHNILIPPSILLELINIPDGENIINKILMAHIIPGRIVNPNSIKTRGSPYKNKAGEEVLLRISDMPDKSIYVSSNGFDCRVTGIIKAKRGYIYKIDHILTLQWSPGPSIIDFIRTSDDYYKLQYILKALQPDTVLEINRSGPVTIFLVPDSGWLFHGKKLVPKCVFDSLAKPENAALINNVLQTLALPGIYKKKDIQLLSWLPVISSPPQLAVAHVEHTKCSVSSKTNITKIDSDIQENACEKSTFIEGHQVIEWDIPIMNGVVHILSEAIITPENEQRITDIAFWNCTHQFCRECPKLVKIILKYLDEDGLLPTEEAFQWATPPGVRPDWVCRGFNGYYPAGWTFLSWKRHLDNMKKNIFQKMYEKALVRATRKREEIANRYDIINQQSKQILQQYNRHIPLTDGRYLPAYYILNIESKGKQLTCENNL